MGEHPYGEDGGYVERTDTLYFFFLRAKIAVHIIDIKELELWEPMATSYPVEGEKPKTYKISSFL